MTTQSLTSNTKSDINKILFILSSTILYIALYLFVNQKLHDFFNPSIGIIIIILTTSLDYILSRLRWRIFTRLFGIIVVYFVIRGLIILLSYLASPENTYNFFDNLPYFFLRDSVFAILFVVYYFIFDAVRVKKENVVLYVVSSLILGVGFFFVFYFTKSINKTFFKNYFNYSIAIIIVTMVFIFRHITFYQKVVKRNLKRKDLLLFAILLVSIIFLIFSVCLPGHIKKQNSKTGKNNGLLSQNMFNFNFDDLVKLESEIKLGDERVLLMELNGVRDRYSKHINKGWNRQIYLKRFSLEEFTPNGNFKIPNQYGDPYSPPKFISDYMWELDNPPKYSLRRDISQTLYLVNIDPSSLMGSDLLYKVAPIKVEANLPFKQIYRSYCSVFDSTYRQLLKNKLTQVKFKESLPPQRKKLLLNWGDPKRNKKIQELAKKITKSYTEPFWKAVALTIYLQDHYYYSLKPGIAGKGKTQLEHFLFESKKGYCSYFAFAMTQMLRSLGIVARVAVGFAPDMENSTLNFYEIRAVDAHAWVEVYFDEYGWITFDPTSSTFDPSEKFEFPKGNKKERDDLIEIILKHKKEMKEVNEKEKLIKSVLDNIVNKIKHSVRWLGIALFILILTLFIGVLYFRKNYYALRYLLSRNNRKKIVFLYRDILSRLLDLGYAIDKKSGIMEFAEQLKSENIIDITLLTSYYQKAIFKEQKKFDITREEIKGIKNDIKKQFKKFPLHKKIIAFFSIKRLWRGLFPLLLVTLIGSITYNGYADIDDSTIKVSQYDTLDGYITAAKDAFNFSYFDKGFKLLDEAEKRYPDSYRPNLVRGNQYYESELYENALVEFLKAKSKGYITEKLFINIANSYGSIGNDPMALQTYIEAFDKLYPSENLYDNIGWMYFKVHKITEGIAKVKEGLKKYKRSASLSMTLGTLYSGIWDYDNSKKYYLDSIKYASENFGSSNFKAIAYYNLALLEQAFLKYDNALYSCQAAVSFMSRSSSHMELSYLYTDALQLKKAYKEVITASSLQPKTFFPEESLIQIYIMAGYFDEAIKLSKSLLKRKDFSWMLYFGTNKEIFFSEIYKLLSLSYKYKANQIKFLHKRSFWNNLAVPFKRLYYKAAAFLYNLRYTNIYIKVSREKKKGGGEIEALHDLISAYENIYPSKAIKMINLVKKIELPQNPDKKRLYDLQIAILKNHLTFKNKKKIKEQLLFNVNLLDKNWENSYYANGLVELIKLSHGEERRKYKVELFKVQPSFLPANNFTIDMNVIIDTVDLSKKKLLNYLKKIGIKNRRDAKLSLYITQNSSDRCEIQVISDNKESLKYETILYNNIKKSYDSIVTNIFKKIFMIEVN